MGIRIANYMTALQWRVEPNYPCPKKRLYPAGVEVNSGGKNQIINPWY